MSTKPAARTVERAAVYTHDRAEETARGVQLLIAAARKAGVELLFDSDETVKHGLDGSVGDGVRINASPEEQADVCVVLGGDGATLRALRANTGTGVPVFAVNFGRIGFLATVDRAELDEGLERALSGRFDVLPLPALVLDGPSSELFAINEVSFQRRSHLNMAHLTYSLAGEEVARVPCDGLIAATPVGSTGYNLSVGGPILAWEVKGFTVSLIAPHALGARALVAAPEDALTVVNDGFDPVDIVVDGIPTGELVARKSAEISFRPEVVGLAQLPGTSFYRRFREKLIQLTS
jgi:NAD+ kinase